MKHFLAPFERKNSWLIYLASIIFVFVGIFSFGTMISYFIVSSRIDVKPTTTPAEISNAFSYNEQFIITLVPFLVGFGLLMFVAKVFHVRTFLSFITIRERFSLKRFGIGFAIWGAILMANFFVAFAGGAPYLQWNFDLNSFVYLLFISIFLVPFQTGFEEILLRGFAMQMFARVTKRAFSAIIISALIFMALHLGNPELDNYGWTILVFYLLSGVMTSLVTVMDDGVELSWGFHTANNFYSILLITNNYQAFRTDAIFLDTSEPTIGPEILIVPLLFFPLFVFILWRIFKWKNWKEKLFRPLELSYFTPKNEETDDDA